MPACCKAPVSARSVDAQALLAIYARMTLTKLDLSGLKCPLPALKTRKALKALQPGDRLEVRCTDPLSVIDIPNLIRETGDKVEITERAEQRIVFGVHDRERLPSPLAAALLVAAQPDPGETRRGRHRDSSKPVRLRVGEQRAKRRQMLLGEQLEPDRAHPPMLRGCFHLPERQPEARKEASLREHRGEAARRRAWASDRRRALN